MRRFLVLNLLLAVVAAVLSGCGVKSLAATNAFAYACAKGGECAVYLTLTNPGREEEWLVAARTDISDYAELHRLSADPEGGFAMHPVESIRVPAHDVVELQPGSLHIMLYNVSRELKAGDTFVLTLQYEPGGEKDVEVVVMPEN